MASSPAEVEKRSVDWIPHNERFGKTRSLGNVWFVSNVNLTAMATGIVALSLGANLIWTLIAIVLGSIFGTFFMAFHSAQGPQMGLPQLIQSRAQFGYYGAALTVWIFALVNYWAYNTSDAILSGQAINSLIPGISTGVGFVLAAIIATVIAVFGYAQIHWINKILLWPSLIVLTLLTVGIFIRGSIPAGAFDLGQFNAPGFMTAFVMVSGFQLGWAPYVSDYSRYLPGNVGVKQTFWWTYLPSTLSAVWVFGLGAIASGPDGKLTPVQAFAAVGDAIVPGFGNVAVALLLVGLLAIMGINAYGGSLSMISILDSFVKVNPTKLIRVATLALMGVAVWYTAAVVGADSFNAFYSNALVFLAYMFTPWTAINLVDYFWVRRGKYVIMDLFNPKGIYGRWGWRGNTAYFVGILAMVPFFVTTPFVGPIAKALGNVDYSLFVGLPIAAGLYLLLAKNLDIKSEHEAAANEGNLTSHK